QWHFGMKAHIGVDAKSGLTHSLVTTAANEHDLKLAMLFTLANLFRVDQMIRQWERSQ
ncbi:transposase, partial [Klebsiella quasipneumoniae]|nr:transposase [Klebsiella quasipneumoniae]NGX19568.1 transposase [Klebsiella quasipneumoniae]NGX23858.1 transposase [Klebsiella quasipneumoniae]